MNKISIGLVVVIIIGVIILNGEWNYTKDKIFAGVELERRGFVMSVIMFEDDIVLEIANEEENDWQSNSQYVRLKTSSLKAAEEIYKANGDRELDFSHMKILFVDEGLVDEKSYDEKLNYDRQENRNDDSADKKHFQNNWQYDNQYKQNLEYMYSEEKFGENILVCELSGDLNEMAANAIKDEKALAVKIENILKTSGKDKGRELYKVRNDIKK